MSTLEAKVKAVLSGDTIILHNVNNPKQERTLSLAFVTAPRLKREGDEVRGFLDGKTVLVHMYVYQCG
jgi:staphylococcal nuclease domain-containing protein 1